LTSRYLKVRSALPGSFYRMETQRFLAGSGLIAFAPLFPKVEEYQLEQDLNQWRKRGNIVKHSARCFA